MSDDINRQLEELKTENERLRQQLQSSSPQPKPTTTHIATWKGHPVIRFEGNFKPFGLGLKKSSVILECIEDVKFFVENNLHKLPHVPDNDPE